MAEAASRVGASSKSSKGPATGYTDFYRRTDTTPSTADRSPTRQPGGFASRGGAFGPSKTQLPGSGKQGFSKGARNVSDDEEDPRNGALRRRLKGASGKFSVKQRKIRVPKTR